MPKTAQIATVQGCVLHRFDVYHLLLDNCPRPATLRFHISLRVMPGSTARTRTPPLRQFSQHCL
ncbi:hypothetical protein ACMYUJ_19690 [Stutzerimonas zhaodongensis]|uniref:hypothetical protein n=1 Tax=Stutzerimonas zhaodongensis TaxID=1176257 RepID=UPI0039EE8D70